MTIRSTLRVFVALVVCLALAQVAPAQKPNDETIQNFKRYYGKYEDVPSRVEAILTLEGIEDVGVVDLLVGKLKDPEPDISRAVVRVFSAFKTRPPIDALLVVLKTDKTEVVRTSLLRAIAAGKFPDTSAAVAACLTDKAWEVRRYAIGALVTSGDATQAPAIAPLCADTEPGVRCVALDALSKLNSDLVVEKAIAALGDSVWQVRKSGIDALTKVRSKDAIEPLINLLAKEEGVLTPDIAEALANLTGKEFGAKPDKWKAWWNENKASFTLPSAEAIAYLRGKKEAKTGTSSKSDYYKSGVVSYNGIDTPSRSIMFVIDVSGSMEALVTEKERFEGGHYPPPLSRMNIVKVELQRTIDHLEPYVNFGIIAFATDLDPWKKALVPANILNKSAAKEWVGHLDAIGGSSKEDLATVGLAGSANLDKGKTNTYGSLMAALGVKAGAKTGDKDYLVQVDTIFFLSDGQPTVGTYVDRDDILREVRTVNELRKVVIHTIAIGEFQKDWMKRLAEQNHGVFVDLGR